MKDMNVSAKTSEKKNSEGAIVSKAAGPATISVKVPETINEAIQMYGGDILLANALANWTVTLQAGIRSRLTKGMPEDQIQAEMADSKMGAVTRSAAIDPQAAFIAKFRTATPEQQAEMLAKLQEAAAA